MLVSLDICTIYTIQNNLWIPSQWLDGRISAVLICIIIVDTPYSPLGLNTYTVQFLASLIIFSAGLGFMSPYISYLDDLYAPVKSDDYQIHGIINLILWSPRAKACSGTLAVIHYKIWALQWYTPMYLCVRDVVSNSSFLTELHYIASAIALPDTGKNLKREVPPSDLGKVCHFGISCFRNYSRRW